MIKLIDILNEIGDASLQPYPFDYYGSYAGARIYHFDTKNHPYGVELFHDEDTPNEMSVRFYIIDKEHPDIARDDVVTDKGELFKVMSTVTNIIKKDLKFHPEIDTITFVPNKKSGETTNVSRLNLYLKYIKNSYPGAEITTSNGTTTVKLK
jgi:hypothetical protein